MGLIDFSRPLMPAFVIQAVPHSHLRESHFVAGECPSQGGFDIRVLAFWTGHIRLHSIEIGGTLYSVTVNQYRPG